MKKLYYCEMLFQSHVTDNFRCIDRGNNWNVLFDQFKIESSTRVAAADNVPDVGASRAAHGDFPHIVSRR